MSFLTMQQNVLGRARQDGTWATARVKDYLNACVRELWQRNPNFGALEMESTTDGVVGQSNYELPSDFVRALHVELRDGTSYYDMTAVPPEKIDASIADYAGSEGLPATYSIAYQELRFGCEFDKTYTIFMRYVCKPTDMSSDSDTTFFPEYLLEEYAYAFLMRDLGRNNEYAGAFNRWEAMAEKWAAGDLNPDQVVTMFGPGCGISEYWRMT